MKNFFICEYQILEQGLDIGFHLYAPGHLIWLAAIAAAVVWFSAHYQKEDEIDRLRMRRIFAVLILLSEIYKDIVLLIMDAPMMQYLPLHLCSFAIFGMLIDACMPQRRDSSDLSRALADRWHIAAAHGSDLFLRQADRGELHVYE